jgi:hypothetical protein
VNDVCPDRHALLKFAARGRRLEEALAPREGSRAARPNTRAHCTRTGATLPGCELRQFEYEVGLLAADGKTGVDGARLREQLDMSTGLTRLSA